MKRTLQAIGVIGVIMTSCSPLYYVPNTQNVPLLSKQGEYNIGASASSHLVELQTSVSPVDHMGIQLNGSWFIPQREDNGDHGSGYIMDMGLGYNTTFGFDDKFVFEAYGIGGIGGVNNTFVYRDSATTGGSFSANVGRYGVQPILGFKSKYIDVAVSSRFVGLSYFNERGDLMFNNVQQRNYIDENRHSFVIEPAFTFRAGIDFLKFQIQVQGSFNSNHPSFYQRNSQITLGIIFSPNRYRNIFKPAVKTN